MTRTALFAAALLALTVRAATAQAGPRPDSLALARQFTQWFYAGAVDSLWAHTDPRIQEKMGSPDAYREMRGQMVSHAGTETEVVSERFVRRLGKPQYWRVAKFTLTQEEVLFRWVVTDGLIGGLGMGPASDAPPVDQP